MLNNVVGYWAYIRGGLYLGVLYIFGGGAYIRGLIFEMRRALVHVMGLYMGGLYSEVYSSVS